MAEVMIVCLTEDNPLQNKSISRNTLYGTFQLTFEVFVMYRHGNGFHWVVFFWVLWNVKMNELHARLDQGLKTINKCDEFQKPNSFYNFKYNC